MKAASKISQLHDFCDDDPRVFATHLLELHGYQKACETIQSYLNDLNNDAQRDEWQQIAQELDALVASD